MALSAIVPLDSDGQRLAGDEFFGRQNLGVSSQIIGAEILHIPMRNPRIKPLQRARTSIATFPLKQLCPLTESSTFQSQSFCVFFASMVKNTSGEKPARVRNVLRASGRFQNSATCAVDCCTWLDFRGRTRVSAAAGNNPARIVPDCVVTREIPCQPPTTEIISPSFDAQTVRVFGDAGWSSPVAR